MQIIKPNSLINSFIPQTFTGVSIGQVLYQEFAMQRFRRKQVCNSMGFAWRGEDRPQGNHYIT